MVSFKHAIRCGLLALLVAPVAGCHEHDDGFRHDDRRFLEEDVVDLMTVVFQAAENSFVGDNVDPADVITAPDAGNNFQVVYSLPSAFRPNLGTGAGRAAFRVFEDGVVNPDPLSFSSATTTALTLEARYELLYDGGARGGRATNVSLTVTLIGTRPNAAQNFVVEYTVGGGVHIGATRCTISALFRAAGRPRDGIQSYIGDASGIIDDPDVHGDLELDIDFFEFHFRAEGEVGCCGYFEEEFNYFEAL